MIRLCCSVGSEGGDSLDCEDHLGQMDCWDLLPVWHPLDRMASDLAFSDHS